MADNVASPAVNIEMNSMSNRTTSKENLKQENNINGNGVKTAIAPTPQIKDTPNENQAGDDFINGLIAGLDDMITHDIKEADTKRIEKKTGSKIQEVIDWISSGVAIVYVIVLVFIR